MVELTRRQALSLGFGSLALFIMARAVPSYLVIDDAPAKAGAEAWDYFRQLFTDLDSARDLGHQYLRFFAHESDVPLLRRAVIGSARPRDVNHLRALLAQKREHDFRTGDIAIVDGWVLSRSEARVCALIALL
jgi:hypothetical protein